MTTPVDVYIADAHPYYVVMVDGQPYKTLNVINGVPLTWSQQWEIADNFKESLTIWPLDNAR